MSWEMYLAMTGFLTLMLAVFYIVAWAVLGKVEWQIREGRAGCGNESGETGRQDLLRRRLPLWKALSLALVSAWLIVHFIVKP